MWENCNIEHIVFLNRTRLYIQRCSVSFLSFVAEKFFFYICIIYYHYTHGGS